MKNEIKFMTNVLKLCYTSDMWILIRMDRAEFQVLDFRFFKEMI